MAVLLVIEHDNAAPSPVNAKAVTAARALGGPVHALVAGEGCRPVAEAVARLAGVDKVLLAESPALAHLLAEPMAALVACLAAGHGAVVAPSCANMKNILPRAAALLDVQPISDVSKVLSADTFERPIYAGNAIQTVQSRDAIKVVTVRTASFAPAGEGPAAPIESVEGVAAETGATFVRQELVASDRPELAAARIVVSGGRALGSAETFRQVMEPLADRLGAAIGASRAAVDAGYAPNDWQVGQTGKVVAPDLYVAVGISGAIQHVAGMKDSKVIVAINKDEEAPIFQIADYGLVGDLFTILPELERELARAKA